LAGMTQMPVDPQCHCFSNPADLINGIPVSAETLQPILDTLYANDLFVKSVLDYFEMPSALKRCVEINPAVQVGQPVFYSSITSRFELARYASVVSASGRVFLNDTAEVWGILQEKTGTDAGIIVICGMANVDLTAALNGAPPVGKFYLDVVAGRLVSSPPDELAPVYVLSALADGSILFRPWSGEYAGIVLQWKRELSTTVAGNGNIVDGRGVISSADTDEPGWLPADHAIFAGNAPAGAVFGYNLSQDSNLAGLWPPRYLSTVYLDLDRALVPAVGGTSVPLGGDGLAVVDEHGIWWLSDCDTDLPFDVNESPASDLGICPREPKKRLTLYAARPAGFAAGSTSQTSLISKHPAFRFVQRDGTALAETGPLDFTFDPDKLLSTVTNDTLGLAVKRTVDNKLSRGPVVAGLKSGSAQITVTGTDSYGDGYQHGEVTIDASGFVQQELLPLTVALSRAEEEVAFGTLGIGLPPYRPSSFRSQFVIPLGINGRARVSYRVWVMANYPSNGGSFAPTTEQLSMVARVIPQPNEATFVPATADFAVAYPASPIVHATAYEQISTSFTAGAGDVVYTELFRNPESRLHELHVIKHFLFIHEILPPDAGTTTCAPCDPTTTGTPTTTTGTPTTTTGTPTTTTGTPTTTTVTPATTEAPIAMGCCDDDFPVSVPGDMIFDPFVEITLSALPGSPFFSYCPSLSTKSINTQSGSRELTVAWEYTPLAGTVAASPLAVLKYDDDKFDLVSYSPAISQADGSLTTVSGLWDLWEDYPNDVLTGGVHYPAGELNQVIRWGSLADTVYSVTLALKPGFACPTDPQSIYESAGSPGSPAQELFASIQVSSEADPGHAYETSGQCSPWGIEESRTVSPFRKHIDSVVQDMIPYCFAPRVMVMQASLTDTHHLDSKARELEGFDSAGTPVRVASDPVMPTKIMIKWTFSSTNTIEVAGNVIDVGESPLETYPRPLVMIDGPFTLISVDPPIAGLLNGLANPGIERGYCFGDGEGMRTFIPRTAPSYPLPTIPGGVLVTCPEVTSGVATITESARINWGDTTSQTYSIVISIDQPCLDSAQQTPIAVTVSAHAYPDLAYVSELTCPETTPLPPLACELTDWPHGGRQIKPFETWDDVFGCLPGDQIPAIRLDDLVPTDCSSAIDVTFIVDMTEIMSTEVARLQAGIGTFLAALATTSANYRVSIIQFSDAPNTAPHLAQILPFTAGNSSDNAAIIAGINSIGGPYPDINSGVQSSLALQMAADQVFQPLPAARVAFFFTNTYPNLGFPALFTAAESLAAANVRVASIYMRDVLAFSAEEPLVLAAFPAISAITSGVDSILPITGSLGPNQLSPLIVAMLDLICGTVAIEDYVPWNTLHEDHVDNDVSITPVVDINYIWLDESEANPLQTENLALITWWYPDVPRDSGVSVSPQARLTIRHPSFDILSVYPEPRAEDQIQNSSTGPWHDDLTALTNPFGISWPSGPLNMQTQTVMWGTNPSRFYRALVRFDQNANFDPGSSVPLTPEADIVSTLLGYIEVASMAGETCGTGRTVVALMPACVPTPPEIPCGTGCYDFDDHDHPDDVHTITPWTGVLPRICPVDPLLLPVDYVFPPQLVRWKADSICILRVKNMDVKFVHPIVSHPQTEVGPDGETIYTLRYQTNNPYYHYDPRYRPRYVASPPDPIQFPLPGLFIAELILTGAVAAAAGPDDIWYAIQVQDIDHTTPLIGRPFSKKYVRPCSPVCGPGCIDVGDPTYTLVSSVGGFIVPDISVTGVRPLCNVGEEVTFTLLNYPLVANNGNQAAFILTANSCLEIVDAGINGVSSNAAGYAASLEAGYSVATIAGNMQSVAFASQVDSGGGTTPAPGSTSAPAPTVPPGTTIYVTVRRTCANVFIAGFGSAELSINAGDGQGLSRASFQICSPDAGTTSAP